MWDILYDHYPLAIFTALAVAKGGVEVFAGHSCNKGGAESSILISRSFIVIGILTPVLIFLEIFFWRHCLPFGLSVFFAAIMLFLMYLRVICIKTLGEFYSVNIRTVDNHRLIRKGIYRYFRHPIYLIGLLENFFYPMAAGAYVTTIILLLLGTPPILIRRKEEEVHLRARFGREYEEYRRTTWF